jgi:putative transposase
MRRFKSARQLQRFLSVHDQVANVFQHCRYNRDAKVKRAARAQALQTWEEVSCAQWMKKDAN